MLQIEQVVSEITEWISVAQTVAISPVRKQVNVVFGLTSVPRDAPRVSEMTCSLLAATCRSGLCRQSKIQSEAYKQPTRNTVERTTVGSQHCCEFSG